VEQRNLLIFKLYSVMKYRVLQSPRIRILHLKSSNTISHSDIQEKLERAFEKGYKLGRGDTKEGIFIDLDAVVEQFRATMSADENNQ
jgi:hypothetical protein